MTKGIAAHNQARKEQRWKAMIDAANEMIAKGQLISHRTLSAKVKEMTGTGLSPKTYRRFYKLEWPRLRELFRMPWHHAQ